MKFFSVESDLLNDSLALRVLIVDDERPIRRFLRASLGSQFTIFEAENGSDALQLVSVSRPDLVLLDLGLPDLDGVEVTRRLREWTLVPIIVISVRTDEAEKVLALDAGADDYLTKPFSVSELLARMRATLRHCAKPEDEPLYQSGNLMVNLSKRDVLVGGERVALTPTEFGILRALVLHAGRVLTHQQLIKAVWAGNEEADHVVADAHLLRVNVSNLRRKIESNPATPRYILTEPGVGYRLNNDKEPA
jgi:two-component system KDP operon response regulator KdpE